MKKNSEKESGKRIRKKSKRAGASARLVLLSAAAAVLLCACGGRKGSTEGDNSLAKQYVYSGQEIDFGEETGSPDIQALAYRNDRIYFAMTVLLGDSPVAIAEAAAAPGGEVVELTPEEEEAAQGVRRVMRVVSCKTDGSDLQTVDLQADGEKDQQDADQGQTTDSYAGAMAFGADDSLYLIRETYRVDNTDPDNPTYENWQDLCRYRLTDGELQWEKSLKELKGDADYYSVRRLLSAEDGTIYLLGYLDGQNSLAVFDPQGNLLSELDVNSALNEGELNTIQIRADGSLLLICYSQDYSQLEALPYDLASGNVGEKTPLPSNFTNYTLYQGKNTDFILSGPTGVYTYTLGDEEIRQIMNYVNSDLAVNYMQYFVEVDPEHFVGVYADGVDYSTKAAIFTKVDPKDIPDKSALVLGVNGLSSDVRQSVIDFNKANDRYRITVRDYSEFSTAEDYMASYTKLNNDILSGDMPDILLTNYNMRTENYAAKGLLADVGKLLEEDGELSREDFLENVFRAYSIDGTLYSVVPSFSVNTIAGKASVVGKERGWTMEEFQSLMDSLPEGTQGFGDVSRDNFLSMMMTFCGVDFIDPTTGKCSFDSPEFLNILEFAKTLPDGSSEGSVAMDDSYWKDYETQYRENRTVLMRVSVSDVSNLNYTIVGGFGEEITFIGFPNENRNGSVLAATMSYVLSARSKNLEGAWEFVKVFLSEDYQKKISWGLPVLRSAFLEKAQEATKRPYYLDENGQKVEYDNTYYLNDEEVIIPPLTQEEVDQIVSFLESVDKIEYSNDAVMDIINEEIPAFFEGQKSAQEAAQVIQSRAQLLVEENR